ncbi:xanthine dehydrogenase [Bradyrhizobium sp. CCGUVB1N3]|uniref:xanthine dehydrogenase n=1 Tax=Bradyrhizobium sp. CCGUVB1N3 TaxID=2949629 RepID=UPI0020B3B61B|nr:xanthine dehydrogenase [Bradyrhizobium sp. CCGUVB1N3]MCP3476096.1 xanthine dehydrogenase [Bradyrhizobium sp. CCGUVB1N3]
MKVTAKAHHPGAPRLFALVLGTNEIASAIATKLTEATFAVVMRHDAFPPVIRRRMAFHDSLFGELCEVEGVVGKRADTLAEITWIHADPNSVAVTEMHFFDIIALRSLSVIVDARMQKRRTPRDLRGFAPVTVGIGPGFEVGVNCDTAIETHPIQTATIVSRGVTKLADGRAGELGGAGRERFVYSHRDGIWRSGVDIGTPLSKGLLVGCLGGKPVLAPIGGVLRGVARDGARVPEGVKLLEVDPRGRQSCWTGMDERGRAIGCNAVAAIEKLISPRPGDCPHLRR